MATISNTYATEIINLIKNDTPFIALFNGDPAGAGVEISGGDYARIDPSLGAVTNKASSNSSELRWANMPASTVTHVAFYNAVTAGTLRLSGALTSSVALESGDEFFFPIGNLTVTASGA